MTVADNSDSSELTCTLLLLVATPAEEKGLKEAAAACAIPWKKVKNTEFRLDIEHYFDLGPVGNQSRVIALPPSKDASRNLVMGSIGYFGTAARAMRFRQVTRAFAVVQVGMAFGIAPEWQKLGDVLVATSLIPYDNRDIKPARRGRLARWVCGEGSVTEYNQVVREPARLELVELFRKEQNRRRQPPRDNSSFDVHLGALLSGSARIHYRHFRDELVRSVPWEPDLIVGGEMEGVGLLAASDSWDDPVWCVVKGISDFADEDRDAVIKASRPVACRNAGEFVLSALINDTRSEEVNTGE
ncbi:5'-methylthioadenosine/S-adenosylhomocysteine nucleosidase family protein [Aquisphaera insulae]|uniref:5'-methylthioadenosine/S-adenosylhomocysteine nucleosidase family protein n=1 Tax=Aquisphaera insulae TaxID=2712864 RepID=UPI0013EC9709|nr:5'-methylthioadenosine/S-adenosylhomocysteine nucleosidase [Aquisphaera insulae]